MSFDDDYDLIFKVVLIGDSGVGKSNILSRYLKDEFSMQTKTTVGVEFGAKKIEIDKTKIKAQIWDTAGQEQFKSITRSYYRAVAGALLVYDVTNEQSFLNVKNWLEEARANANPELVILLCGNKVDMEDKRVIPTERGRKLAELNGILFMETSAMKKLNIDSIFMAIAREIKKKVEHGRIDTAVEEFGVRKVSDQANAVKQRKKLAQDAAEKRKAAESDGCC